MVYSGTKITATTSKKKDLRWDEKAAFEGSGYTLSFIEFNDQGLAYRRQMNFVLRSINRIQSDLMIVVFMHGWHHSAKPGDSNVQNFRKVLIALSKSESDAAEQAYGPDATNDRHSVFTSVKSLEFA